MKSVRLASVWMVVAGLLLGGCGNAKAQGITAQQAEEMLGGRSGRAAGGGAGGPAGADDLDAGSAR